MHAYVVENWRRQLVLLNLEKVVDGGIFNNIIIVIIRSFIDLGGLLMVDSVNKVV
jgi:hypothetical protein